jgi:hypothetical protein
VFAERQTAEVDFSTADLREARSAVQDAADALLRRYPLRQQR